MRVIKVKCCKLCPYFIYKSGMIKEWDAYYSCDLYGALGSGHVDFDFDNKIHSKCQLPEMVLSKD